ncbi:hypothetical protein ACIBI4_14335 [Streptomyces sp. NPDC050418]|uniref:hypothetical protein n=1 Tax=Streptomyces sp. NPDC050418 TaxID=3365612 RepID=UPI0037965B84
MLVAVVLALTGFQTSSTSGGKSGSGKSRSGSSSGGGGGGCSSGKSRSSSTSGGYRDTDHDDDDYGDDSGYGSSGGAEEPTEEPTAEPTAATDGTTAVVVKCLGDDEKSGRKKRGSTTKRRKAGYDKASEVKVHAVTGGKYRVGVMFTDVMGVRQDGNEVTLTLKADETRTVRVPMTRPAQAPKVQGCEVDEVTLLD